MTAIVGGLAAAAAWAISTLCSSRSSRMSEPRSVVAGVMLVGLVISVPAAALHGVPSNLDGAAGAWLLLSGVGNVAGLVLAYHALRIGQVGIVAPVISCEGAIAAVIATLAGEALGLGAGLALAAIAVGVCLAAVPAPRRSRVAAASHPAAVAFAILGACSFGISLYATGRAALALPSAWVVLSARAVGTVALAIPLAATGRLRLPARSLPLVAGAGICEVLGFYAYAAGARDGIAVAAVLSSQFAAIAAVVAYVLFGERLSRVQLAGVIVVVAGVALLSAVRT